MSLNGPKEFSYSNNFIHDDPSNDLLDKLSRNFAENTIDPKMLHITTSSSFTSESSAVPGIPFVSGNAVPLTFQFDKNNNQSLVEKPKQLANESDMKVLLEIGRLKRRHQKIAEDIIISQLKIDKTSFEERIMWLKENGYLSSTSKYWHKIKKKGQQYIKTEEENHNPKRRRTSECLSTKYEQPLADSDKNVLLAIESLRDKHERVTDVAIRNKANILQTTLDESKIRLKKNKYLSNTRKRQYTITRKGKHCIERIKNIEGKTLPKKRNKKRYKREEKNEILSSSLTLQFNMPNNTTSSSISSASSAAPPETPLTFQFSKNAKGKNNSQSLVEESEQSVNEIDYKVLCTIGRLKKLHSGVTDEKVKSRLNIDQATLNASKVLLKEKGYLLDTNKLWHTITDKGYDFLREKTSLEERTPKRRKRRR